MILYDSESDFTFTPHSLPGFDKNPMHKDQLCYGEDLRRVANIDGFTLRYFLRFYWKSNAGSAFFDRARWFDLLMGTDTVRKEILAGKSETEIRAGWKTELQKYKEMREKYLLYWFGTRMFHLVSILWENILNALKLNSHRIEKSFSIGWNKILNLMKQSETLKDSIYSLPSNN